jgi:hypothetical protein
MSDEDEPVDQYSSALHEFCGFEGVGGLIVSNDSSDEDEPPSKDDRVNALDRAPDGVMAAQKEDDTAVPTDTLPDDIYAFGDFGGASTAENAAPSDANINAFDIAPLQNNNEPDEFGDNFPPSCAHTGESKNLTVAEMETGEIEHEGFASFEAIHSSENGGLAGQEINEDAQMNKDIGSVKFDTLMESIGENSIRELNLADATSSGDATDEFDVLGDFNGIAVANNQLANANFDAFESPSLHNEPYDAVADLTPVYVLSNPDDEFDALDNSDGMDVSQKNGATAVDANLDAYDATSVNIDPNVGEQTKEPPRDENELDAGKLIPCDQIDEVLEAHNAVLDSPNANHSQELAYSDRLSTFDASTAIDAKLVKTNNDEVETEKILTSIDDISPEANDNEVATSTERDVFAAFDGQTAFREDAVDAEFTAEMSKAEAMQDSINELSAHSATPVLAADTDQVIYTEEENTSSREGLPLDENATKQEYSAEPNLDDTNTVADSGAVTTKHFELASEEPADDMVFNMSSESKDSVASINDDCGDFASFEEHVGSSVQNGQGFGDLQTVTKAQTPQTPNNQSLAESEDDNFEDFGDFEEVPAQESDTTESTFEGFATFESTAPPDAVGTEFASFDDTPSSTAAAENDKPHDEASFGDFGDFEDVPSVQTQQSDLRPNNQVSATTTSPDEDDFGFGEFEEVSRLHRDGDFQEQEKNAPASADIQESECSSEHTSFPIVLSENVRVMLQTVFKHMSKDNPSENNEALPHDVTLLSVIVSSLDTI